MKAAVLPFNAESIETEQDEPRIMLSIKDGARKTGMPEHLIRSLALEGKIPALRAGSKKIWINYNGLLEYLASSRLV